MPFNQTRPKGPQHFWAKAKASCFQVRSIGYKSSKAKEPSAAPLYECIGVDLVRSNKLITNVSSHAIFQKILNDKEPAGIPYPWTRKDVKWNEKLHVPRLLIINTQLPYSAPSLWAPQSADSDPGFSLISYYAISPETVELLSTEGRQIPPAVTLLRRLIEEGKSVKESTALKAIGLIDNMEELGMPDMIAGYNGKPVLVTKSAKIFSSSSEILDIEYDVRQWNILARKSLHSFHDKLKEAKCQMGTLIEGKTDEELPEQLLGCYRVNYLDINEALNI
jgi:hypothetical protein